MSIDHKPTPAQILKLKNEHGLRWEDMADMAYLSSYHAVSECVSNGKRPLRKMRISAWYAICSRVVLPDAEVEKIIDRMGK